MFANFANLSPELLRVELFTRFQTLVNNCYSAAMAWRRSRGTSVEGKADERRETRVEEKL